MSRAWVLMALMVGGCSGPEMQFSDLGSTVGLQGPEESSDLLTGHSSVQSPDARRMQAICRQLMDRSGISAISRCPTAAGDRGELRLPASPGCVRDSYVLTALAYCWRSECLNAAGITEADLAAGRADSSPLQEARAAGRMLEQAGRLCGSGPQTSCSTSGLIACPGG